MNRIYILGMVVATLLLFACTSSTQPECLESNITNDCQPQRNCPPCNCPAVDCPAVDCPVVDCPVVDCSTCFELNITTTNCSVSVDDYNFVIEQYNQIVGVYKNETGNDWDYIIIS